MSTNIRTLLLNVRQNLPPLNDKRKEKPKEIILIDSSTTTKNSLIQQFHLNCKKNESFENEENCRSSTKTTAESWLKIREKMLIEMEEKRNLEWEQENLTKRLENEEGEEEEVILTDDDSDEDDDNGNSDNLEEKPEDNEEEPKEAHDDHVSINSDDDDDDEDLKDIEDKDEQELDENIQLDDQNADDQDDDNDDDECIFSSRKSKPLPLSDDDNDDDEENETEEIGENIIDTFDYFDRQDDDQNRNYNYNDYVSQNLPLTPIDAVVVDNENHQNQNHQQKNQFDSQMLLELCSGRFNDDQGDDEVVVADDDDDDDESETLQKTNRKPKKSLKIKDFIEDEAELSDADDANDISSDESDDENQDQEFIENLIDEEGVPDDQDELREQVEKIHHKNMLDEDKRQLMIMKEYFFEDGDLYDADGHNNRRKKFKWTLNRNDDDDLINTVIDDDSDSENGDSIEEDDQDQDGQPTNIRLKRTIEQISVDDDEVEIDSNSNSSKLIAQKMMQLNSSKFANQFRKKKNQSSLTSYLIRDQRLKDVMTTTTKNSDELSSSSKTKKLKTNDSISIFDVFNQQQ